mmetsp:Transcript_14658/g.20017  ORF Transcript_14658/g.20017 Transcript_14658/m.20017 type:complete len:85 (+) Transcript_14658:175-429(+)
MFKSAVVLAAIVASASAFAPASSRAFVSQRVALNAEPEWSPPEGMKWEEKDFEAEIKKLEKEAEERLDDKIAELMSNVEKTGKE